ncbi:2-methylcitrate dehydratase PrpD [Variovorax sp. YR266]|uniref:MmgE/PrpD family protein n=1 Tax=Variovorax sp. YR266 TaxID=1884386 RepID=UPI00089D8932|nr:MmgE/PrpD family protein [Variovorax sp. YR266]SDZ70868.1 2-methylcitrate dehydratase PrpD [Variovorax sp. YR266]
MTAASDTKINTRPAHPDLAIDLARFASSLDTARLDDAVVQAVKTNILDTLSCALAGSSAKAIGEVSGLVREWSGTPQADMFVFGGKFPAHHAAWVNGGMSHARDYDDTHDGAILHAGVSTVPAAIAAGQLRGGLSGEDLIAAVAAGLEVTCRLGVGVTVDIVESGFIYTSLLGYFGATAAAGRALGLNEEQMLNAFGIVYSSVAGNHQVTRDASLMKRLQPGLAAQAAVVAVQLAQRGIRGAQGVFDGADGFIRVYLQGRVDREVVRKELGSRFEFLNLSYKPYPCCRDTHAAIDAALQLAKETGRPADEIESIRVGVTAPGYQMVCVPEHVRLAPRTIVEAQFSIPYAVAAAWIDGQIGIRHFSDEGLKRSDILALTARVQPYVDEDIERDWSRFVTPARVIVKFCDGQTAETRVDYPKGHPNNAMTKAEFAAKSADCATFAARPLPDDTSSRLAAAVDRLETIQDIAELVSLMS